MKQTLLQSAEDLEWLRDVHKVWVDACAVAILYGNEDCPERVELFAKDHYTRRPTVYVADESGVLRLQPRQ